MAGAHERFSLAGRGALVTGASRGLGAAIATALAEHGARVVLCGRDRERLEALAARLAGRALAAAVELFDVTDTAAGERALGRLAADVGLHVLVNNAGVQHRAPFGEFPDGELERVMQTNLAAPFRLARGAARLMEPGARIINVCSVMGPQARATVAAYTASKGALAALTRALAVELGPRGITCNGIAPGFFATEMNRALTRDPEFADLVRRRTPLGRWGEPDEIAGAAVFLASPAAAYVNGHVLFVDGGLSVAV